MVNASATPELGGFGVWDLRLLVRVWDSRFRQCSRVLRPGFRACSVGLRYGGRYDMASDLQGRTQKYRKHSRTNYPGDGSSGSWQ